MILYLLYINISNILIKYFLMNFTYLLFLLFNVSTRKFKPLYVNDIIFLLNSTSLYSLYASKCSLRPHTHRKQSMSFSSCICVKSVTISPRWARNRSILLKWPALLLEHEVADKIIARWLKGAVKINYNLNSTYLLLSTNYKPDTILCISHLIQRWI